MLSHRAFARRRPAAQRRLVHDVVVVQRGQVGQLDHDRRLDDLVGAGRGAELGGRAASSSGRNRLPPASTRCPAASAMNGVDAGRRLRAAAVLDARSSPRLGSAASSAGSSRSGRR